MMMKAAVWFLFACAVAVLPVLAFAADKPKAEPLQHCQMQLAEKTVQAKNLDDDRDAKEQRLAALQTQLYMEQQTRKAMESAMADMRKKLDEAATAKPAQ